MGNFIKKLKNNNKKSKSKAHYRLYGLYSGIALMAFSVPLLDVKGLVAVLRHDNLSIRSAWKI